ncbi:MAG: polyprenyl synthetase family protein [Oscillospiraceae bacterium]
MEYSERTALYQQEIEKALNSSILLDHTLQQINVCEAMRYGLLGGGKRIRGIFALEFCRMFSGDFAPAMPAACALEMVHAYSLIHDDLPCMDDDDMRRGKPACHKQFGEALSVLAGDGLLTLAFETLSSFASVSLLGAERTVRLVNALASAAGEYGMLGGQAIDILFEGQTLGEAQHAQMVRMKTGALIRGAVRCGCIAGNAKPQQIAIALEYADCVGMAFQITDDLLDVSGDAVTLGKPVGSDEKEKKNTFITMLGRQEATDKAAALFDHAEMLLTSLERDHSYLSALTCNLANRKS